MNSGLPEMLHCLNTNSASTTDMTVLQRQRSRLKWQHEHLIQHQPLAYLNENDASGASLLTLDSDQGLGEMLPPEAMKPDPGVENGWIDDFGRVLNYGNGSEFEMCYPLPRTVSCPPNVAAAMAAEVASKGKEAALSSDAGRESSKKRKADKTQNLKVGAEDKSEEKKMKGCVEEESKITEQNSNSKSTTTTGSTATNKKNCKGPSANNSKENSKASDVPKPDYIHVRARRGQATDSHSLAERVRREKISERMKYLQDLVPGCNKITGKAGMLDEIINYVQSTHPSEGNPVFTKRDSTSIHALTSLEFLILANADYKTDSSPASFPGTIMIGAVLQLWKQYSLTLPCSTLWIKLRPLVPITTAAGFNLSASLHIALPVSPSTILAFVLTIAT